MDDPEGHESPSGANFGRILQPEPCIPSWNGILGKSGRVAGGRLGSDEMGLGLRWHVPIGGSTGKNAESLWGVIALSKQAGKNANPISEIRRHPAATGFAGGGPRRRQKGG